MTDTDKDEFRVTYFAREWRVTMRHKYEGWWTPVCKASTLEEALIIASDILMRPVSIKGDFQ